jgi:hypothetical protein
MNGYLPQRKVGASVLAGALSVALVWALNVYVLVDRPQIPAEVASALTTILTFVVGYLVPEEGEK